MVTCMPLPLICYFIFTNVKFSLLADSSLSIKDLERFSGRIYIGGEASGSMAEEHQQDATYVRSCYEMKDPDLSAPHKLAQPLN